MVEIPKTEDDSTMSDKVRNGHKSEINMPNITDWIAFQQSSVLLFVLY